MTISNRIRPLPEILEMLREAAEIPSYFEIGPEEAKLLWSMVQHKTEIEVVTDLAEPFRVQIAEVTPALITDDNLFLVWCDKFLRPDLLKGNDVAVKLFDSDLQPKGSQP